MINLIKKTLLAGLGFAYITKEKVEEFVKELIEKGKITEKEGKELLRTLQKQSIKTKEEMEEYIGNFVKATLEKMNVATKEDLQNLEAQLRKDIDGIHNQSTEELKVKDNEKKKKITDK